MTKQSKPPLMKIVFMASLPDILSAITLAGSADSGARIKLDIPASDVGAAILLQQQGAGKLLKVTIEVIEQTMGKNADKARDSTPDDDVDELMAQLKDLE
jgi:hypothetical protein